MKYFKRAKISSETAHNAGNTPSVASLNNSLASTMHHIDFAKNGNLLCYTASTGATINNSIFYIIHPTIKPADYNSSDNTTHKMRLAIMLSCWDHKKTGFLYPKWDGVASDNINDIKFNGSNTQSQTYSFADKPRGLNVFDSKLVDYNNGDTGYGYGVTVFSFANIEPASFTSFIAPLKQSENIDRDGGTGLKSFGMTAGVFNINQSVRGSNGIVLSGSVDSLAQAQVKPFIDDCTSLRTASHCLFQYGHPQGLYYKGISGTLTYKKVFNNLIIKTQARELYHNSNGYYLDLVIMYKADNGAKLKITTDYGSTIYVLTAATSTPLLSVFKYVPKSGTSNDIVIEVLVSDTVAVELYSVALFECSKSSI